MRIAFLCISLEPGRDGVGDYVRQFARALTSRGHSCQAIALADRYSTGPRVEYETTTRPEVVRLPAACWHSGDIELAAERLVQFAPDWISLQMVCYGFERWGLLFRSAGRLARLRFAAKRHMMFHELWVGEAAGSPIKDRMIGWMQRRLLLRATNAWSPTLVHTSNAVYCDLLHRDRIRASVLPLPGNISLCELPPTAARQRLLRRLAILEDSLEPPLLAGVFGSIHAEWGQSDWLGRIEAASRAAGRRLTLIQLGRAGMVGLQVFEGLRRGASDRVSFVELGELPDSEISAVLLGLDFGIATSPWPLIGKSGSIAAMIEHGLPVVVTRTDFQLRGGATPKPASDPLVMQLDEFVVRVRQGALARAPAARRTEAFEIFLRELQGCATPAATTAAATPSQAS